MILKSDQQQRFIRLQRITIQMVIILMVFGISGSITHAESWLDFGAESPNEIEADIFMDTDSGQSQDVAVEKSIDQMTEEAVGKAVEKTIEKATVKAVEETAEKAAEKAVEKAVEKAAEKVAEEASEKAELTAKRPDEWRGATTVYFSVFVLDIDEIDDASQNFTANVFVKLRWKDQRLANPDGGVRQIRLEEVWNPRVLIANRQGLVSKSLPEVVQVYPDGMVMYLQRYTGKLSQILRLTEFPMDKHLFTLHFVATGYSEKDLIFEPDTTRNVVGGSIAKDLSLPDWKVFNYEALPLSYSPIEEINVPGFAFRFEAKRYVSYYIWQVVLPLIVVVVMSWAAFFIERIHVGVRLGVATSAILTLVTLRFVLSNLLPRLPYMTRMDFFTVGSTLLVFMALIAVVLSSFFDGRKKSGIAQKIDICARIVFPTAYVTLLGWFIR